MTQYVKCIDNSHMLDSLTVGKKYKVINIDIYDNDVMIMDDNENSTYYSINRFSFIKEDNISIEEKLNSLKDLLIFLANKQTTSNLEEYETLKNLINEVEEKFS